VLISTEDPLAVEAVDAIHRGDLETLTSLLDQHPELATARLGSEGCSRSLLLVATDWPGHFPQVGQVIRLLVAAGADVNARFEGGHTETALHWAASSDDVEALDALLDLGADIDADGAVIAGGTALADARAFGQWRAAIRLVERGASTTIGDEATLGLLDRLRARFSGPHPPSAEDVDRAFWGACHGGRLDAAQLLHGHGADPNWVPPWEDLTPLDAAQRSHEENGVDATELLAWLRDLGARSAR